MKIAKLIILIIFWGSFGSISYANVAMPGFWDIGAGREFGPVLKKEEKLVKNISMVSELVKVNLYHNFAVVKGEYNMYNTSDSNVSLHVGYPENGIYQNDIVDNIIFNKLENLQVYVDNKTVETKVSPVSDLESKNKQKNSWHIFPVEFKPKGITKIKVYYMVDTHDASLRKGYDTEKSHGFSYILESGQIWEGTISKGRVYIKLMEKLTDNDIMGLLPFDSFKYDPVYKVLVHDFTNLEPSKDSNIVIRYNPPDNGGLVYNNLPAAKYYSEIDKVNAEAKINNKLSAINKNNFRVFPYLEVLIVIIIPVVLALPVFIILWIVKMIKKLRLNNQS
jgi:hypothetical protein